MLFTPDAPAFLAALAADNNRDWFEANRRWYERAVQAPMKALAEALGPAALAIDPAFETRPARVLSRIRRDVRFSKDKTPYRTTAWLTFKRPSEEWVDAPCFFVEMGPGGWRAGMGFYQASPATMTAIRKRILARPAEFEAALAPLAAVGLVPAGERYRRPPKEAAAASEFLDWMMFKSVYLTRERMDFEELFGPDPAAAVAAVFRAAVPLYRFFTAA